MSNDQGPGTRDQGPGTPEYLTSCPHCGCRDLFVRKDFPQKLGLGIVIVAGVAFVVLSVRRSTFYLGIGVLLVACLVDALLYAFVPKITVCYRCRAELRGAAINPRHAGFELAVAEKYRGPGAS